MIARAAGLPLVPPRTRGDCIDGPRPCPWSCRYRLESVDASCCLDVADSNRDGLRLAEIGRLLGVTDEAVRQIEAKALAKLGRRLGGP